MYHPLDALFQLQRALESRLDSEWLRDATAGSGAFPPINVFQQGDSLVAIIELPGVNKNDLDIQAKDNTIRISGKKTISFPEKVSLHRRERLRARRVPPTTTHRKLSAASAAGWCCRERHTREAPTPLRAPSE